MSGLEKYPSPSSRTSTDGPSKTRLPSVPAPVRTATGIAGDSEYRHHNSSGKLASSVDLSLGPSVQGHHQGSVSSFEHSAGVSPTISAVAPQEIHELPEEDEQQYVEFNLNLQPKYNNYKSRGSSVAELVKYGKGSKTDSSLDVAVAAPVPKEAKSEDNNSKDNGDDKDDNNNKIVLSSDDDDDDQDWRQMNTELELEMYNERGELFAKGDEIFLQDRKDILEDGSKLGYTRIAAEEQATKFNKINENFEFLFNGTAQDQNRNTKLHQEDTLETDNKVYFNINDKRNHDSKENVTGKDDEPELTTLNQLSSTKEMLKDSQKIAYVGLVKLVMVEMAIELSKVNINSKSISMNKRISASHANLQQWSIKMMDRLYDHMDLSDEERHMIETLSSHGLEADDLIPSLVTVEKMSNPLLQKDDDENPPEERFISQGDDLSNEVLQVDIKWTLICDLFLILIFDAVFDSRSRVLLLKFGDRLGIKPLEIFQFERKVTELLEIEESSEQIWNEKEILDYRAKSNKKKKIMYVGLATLGGGLVIGLSAGLLAPMIGAGIAAGLTTVGIGGTSGFLAGVGGTSIVTTVGVLSGARIGSKGMAKRVGNVRTFEFRPIHNNKRVSLIVTVSGWMNGNEDDVRLPFSTVDPVMGDIVSLLWEPDMLRSTGATINILATEILTQSIQQILGSTILTLFMASIQWPMMLSKLGYLLDNPWNVSLDRAWSAGIILADTLIQRNLGVRPITLVGFSLGARLIYSCLLELSKRGAYGLIQDVILFGSPVVYKHDDLALCRSVVSGRFVNGFSKKDWILGYLFRATSGGLGTVAGLAPIEAVEGLENFDCTEFVGGHMEYRKQMPKLLKELDWEVLNEEFVEIDEPENMERQRELVNEFEHVKDDLDAKGKKKPFYRKWFKPRKKEWWEVYDEGRREVEAKQKAEASEEPSDEVLNSEEQETGTADDVLFNVDAIAEEVAKIENEVADPNLETPTMAQGEFKPRSFKTRSVDSTPRAAGGEDEGFRSKSFKTISVEAAPPQQEFAPKPFKSPVHKLGNGGEGNVSAGTRKASGALLQAVTFSKDGAESPGPKQDEGHGQQKQDSNTEQEAPRFEYDDDEEFNFTGTDIKMAFA